MSIFISFFTLLANIINTFTKKRYRWPVLLFIVFLIIIMGANTANPDMYAYQVAYDPNREGSDIGYTVLVQLFNMLGFDYTWFRLTLSIIGILLIHATVKKFVANPSIFYILYFIYPFFIDIVQVRNFLVMAILIYSIPLLLSSKRLDNLKYIILILLASTIQLTAIVYLPFIILYKLRNSNYIKTVTFFLIMVVIIISLYRPLLESFSYFIIENFGDVDARVSVYSFIQTNYGFLLLWGLQFINFFIMIWAYRISSRSVSLNPIFSLGQFSNENINQGYKFIKLTLVLNIYAFLFLPFYVFQVTFSRFLRNIVPINIISYIIVEQILKSRGRSNTLFRIIFISYHIFLLIIDLTILYSNIEIMNFFKDNWMIGW